MKSFKKSSDMRVRRTHILLWKALEELLSQPDQKFQSITVNQICEKAMVHRTTFYKHFQDKYDLLFLGFSQFDEEIINNSLEDQIEKPFQTMSKVAMKNIGLFENILKALQNDDLFSNHLKYSMKESLKNDFLVLEQRGKKFPVPIEIMAEFYASMISSLSLWWAQNGRNITPEQMDYYFHQMINKEFFSEHNG